MSRLGAKDEGWAIPAGSGARHAEGRGAYDALTQLFLDASGASHPARPGPSPSAPSRADDRQLEPAPVEAVILGHLPVLASAWVAQYARHLAERDGRPVGLLRVRAGQASLDVVGARSGGAPELLRGESLAAAVAAAAPRVGRWLIRVDVMTEPWLIAQGWVSCITLLASTDQAAVSDTFLTLKSLANRAGDAEAPREFRLAVMGSPPDKADEAIGRLARAADMFLHGRLEIVACVPRIGPGRSVEVFSGPAGDAEELLEGLEPVLSGRERPTAEHPAQRMDEPVASYPANGAAAPGEPAERSGRAGAPHPLASQLPAITALAATCPYAPGVELAADAEGGLHLLAYASASDGADGDRPPQALSHLLTAAAWAAAHLPLIALASPGKALKQSARPVLHLLVDQPRHVRRLLDGDVRVHLLARVQLGERSGWFLTPLN